MGGVGLVRVLRAGGRPTVSSSTVFTRLSRLPTLLTRGSPVSSHLCTQAYHRSHLPFDWHSSGDFLRVLKLKGMSYPYFTPCGYGTEPLCFKGHTGYFNSRTGYHIKMDKFFQYRPVIIAAGAVHLPVANRLTKEYIRIFFH